MSLFICDICCKGFKSRYLLKRHHQNVYICEKKSVKIEEKHKYECNICKYRFNLVQNYNRHIKKQNCKNKEIHNNSINNQTNNNKIEDKTLFINNKIETINVKAESIIHTTSITSSSNTTTSSSNSNITTNTTSNISLSLSLSLNNVVINSRTEDHYINASQLCNAGNKIFDDWYSLETTKEIIKEFEKEIINDTKTVMPENTSLINSNINLENINLEDLKLIDIIDTKETNNSINKDVWIHPDLAICIANWISPYFTLQIGKWIRTLFNHNLELNINLLKDKDDTIKLKEKRIKLLENMYLKKHSRVKYYDKNVIYILTNEYNKKYRNYILGKTVDLTNRLTSYNKSTEHEVVYYKSCKDEEIMNIVEIMVLTKLKDYKELANRDRFILPIDKNISFFTNIIDESINFFN